MEWKKLSDTYFILWIGLETKMKNQIKKIKQNNRPVYLHTKLLFKYV